RECAVQRHSMNFLLLLLILLLILFLVVIFLLIFLPIPQRLYSVLADASERRQSSVLRDLCTRRTACSNNCRLHQMTSAPPPTIFGESTPPASCATARTAPCDPTAGEVIQSLFMGATG